MDKQTVDALYRLYGQRQDIQRQRENATRNFWLGIVNEFAQGTGTRSSVVNALGGNGAVADMLMVAASNRFEALEQQLDKQITDLGGTP